MPRRERIVVAMSGGVDSSLAAALLVEEGYDVVGVSMRLWEGDGDATGSGCCSLDDFLDARRVADRLRIPFYVMDFRADFRRGVVDDFVAQYRWGRTPNPCVRCNQVVKFASFWDRARELGADLLATGHYARRRNGPGGAELLRGRDQDKDQSYFLFAIAREVLARTRFPVGELTKNTVRRLAHERGLPVADKPDSQEVCFTPRGRYADFVETQESSVPVRAGVVVDGTGTVIGHHRGVHRFTIGQRRGLGVKSALAPRYVTAIDAASGVVRVGGGAEVFSMGVVATQANWLARPPAVGTEVGLKIRSRFACQRAIVTSVDGDGFQVVAPDGLRAVTPGQAAVLYDGERVIGGGWISSASPPAAAVGDTVEGAA